MEPVSAVLLVLLGLTAPADRSRAVEGGPPIARLEGPSDLTTVFDGRGTVILTAGAREARLWDAGTFRPLTGPLRHPGGEELVAAAVSPDGGRVLTATALDARLWDGKTGKVLQVLKHAGLRSACFSPDGRRVLTAGDDKFARVWKAETGQEVASREHPDKVKFAAFSPKGGMALSVVFGDVGHVFHSGYCYVWDADTGREYTRRPINGPDVPVAFSPGGRFIAQKSVHRTDHVFTWDTATGQTEFGLVETSGTHGLSFSPDGNYLLAVGGDAQLWDVREDRMVREFDLSEAAAVGLFSPDGARVLTAGFYNTAAVWDVASGQQLLRVEGPDRDDPKPTAAAFSPDGARIVVGFPGADHAGVWAVPLGLGKRE